MSVAISSASLLALHESYCQGDKNAFDQLAATVWPVLRRRLRPRLSFGDDALIEDSITDALLAYHRAPERFDPSRGVPLLSYFFVMGRRRLCHHLRIEVRRRRREDHLLLDPERLDDQEHARLHATIDTEEQSALRHRLADLIRRLSLRERAAVALMCDGVHDVVSWSCLLPLTALPLGRQRTRIKYEKVRVQRKLRRLARSG